jgi:signal transduction histidine kinase
MLTLTSLSHSIPNRIDFNLAELCRLISEQLSLEHPERLLCWDIEPEIPVQADYKLLRIAMENLLGNSVKVHRWPTAGAHFRALANQGGQDLLRRGG